MYKYRIEASAVWLEYYSKCYSYGIGSGWSDGMTRKRNLKRVFHARDTESAVAKARAILADFKAKLPKSLPEYKARLEGSKIRCMTLSAAKLVVLTKLK